MYGQRSDCPLWLLQADASLQGESTRQIDISRENSGGPARLGASRCASFSEVLESCMRSNSSGASQTSFGPHIMQELPEPFIPMPSASGEFSFWHASRCCLLAMLSAVPIAMLCGATVVLSEPRLAGGMKSA
jgi:hypothetical protein